MFDGSRQFTDSFLFASGDNVGASPANSGLLEICPPSMSKTLGLQATSYGNHEFDYGVERLLRHQDRADFPSWRQHRRCSHQSESGLGAGTHVFPFGNLPVGVIGIELENTPELVSAGATEGLKFLDEADTIKIESEKLRQQGIRVQIVLIHQGSANGRNRIDGLTVYPGMDRSSKS